MNKNKLIRRICITAVFIALACVTSLIAGFRLPLFGGDGMHVNLSGIFSSFPAILFGPLYGGATSVFMDLFGCIVKPSGAYNPLFTLTAFCTGFLRGFLWWLVLRLKKNRSLRVTALCVLVLVGVLGCVNHIYLNRDGVMSGYLATTQSVATKGQTERLREEGKLSVFGDITVRLCSNDTLTLTDCSGTGTVVIPAKAEDDGYKSSVTAIGGNVFRDKGIDTVVLPTSIKKIAADAFDAGTTVIVPDTKNKNVTAALAALDVNVQALSQEEYDAYTDYSEITVRSNEDFRDDLALYASGLTVGLEAVCIIGLLIVLADMLLAKRRALAGKSEISFAGLYAAILGAGLIGSTLNTLWLNLLYYSNKAFWVLFIPRTIQEIIIGTVQVCIIAVLYDLFMTRVLPRMRQKDIVMQ